MFVLYILLFASVVMSVTKSAVYNRFAKKQQPDTKDIFLFNMVTYGVAMAVTLFSISGEHFSWPTTVCALAYAAVVFSLQALSVKAMTMGEMSLTSLFVLYGMIIPALAGPVFWGEPFGGGQAAGIVLMLVSLWLLNTSEKNGAALSRCWKLLTALCFLLSGMAGVIEKIHQSTPGRDDRSVFIFMACAMMFVLSMFCCFLKNHRRTEPKTFVPILLPGALTGVIVGFYSKVNLILAGRLDSLIYFPVANGGALLLTVLVSAVVFKEKPTPRKLTGFFMGLISILLISLPV